MKTSSSFNAILILLGLTVLGYDDFCNSTDDELPLIEPIIGWLLSGSGICLLIFSALSKITERNRWLHEHQSGSYPIGLATCRDSDSYRAPDAQLHRRHLFDRYRTDWDLRRR
jgi:hypothetical protein